MCGVGSKPVAQDFTGQGHYSKVKSRSHYDVAHLPTYKCPHQISTSYTLWSLRYTLDKISYVKVTMARSNVQSMSNGKVKGQIKVTLRHCEPTPLYQCLYKYQLTTPYGFQDIDRARSKSLRQGQRSNQGHTVTLHNYTP